LGVCALVDILWFIIFFVGAFWLGACPFAVWIGKGLLDKDVREYGDHNPGAANVFKAGSIAWGFVAVFVEMAKGVPFVLLAQFMSMPEPELYFIGVCAILGHAFSPILKFNGGKASAVTGGVLLAIPKRELFIVVFAVMIIGFFLLEGDGWRVVLGAIGGLLFAILANMGLWPCLFMVCVVAIIGIKNIEALKKLPRAKEKIYIGFGQK
jgi:acyl phosphate:glycerol-3-phosphate acyltransferase